MSLFYVFKYLVVVCIGGAFFVRQPRFDMFNVCRDLLGVFPLGMLRMYCDERAVRAGGRWWLLDCLQITLARNLKVHCSGDAVIGGNVMDRIQPASGMHPTSDYAVGLINSDNTSL